MIQRFLFVVIALSLTACAMRTVKDGSPASDLDALVATVKRDSRVVTLPGNGKEYCLEDSKTEKAQDACAGELEDALYTANRRLERQPVTVEKFATRERLRRNPCNVFQRAFLKRCKV